MARKGYAEEYLAKKELTQTYGEHNVIKVAIGGAQDYIILHQGHLHKIIEVKACHAKKYYESARDKEQKQRIIHLAQEHHTTAERWIKHPRKPFIKQNLHQPN